MKKVFTICIILLFSNASFGQDFSLYKKHLFINNGDTLPYRLLLPENYNASKKYPLIFFMHGAGERGNDNERQLTHGGKLFLDAATRKNYPAIVVFPQCPQKSFWSNVAFSIDTAGRRVFGFNPEAAPTSAMVLAQALLNKLLGSLPVEKTQVYAIGLSMGGMGTFEIVARNPEMFAAAVPICGGANPASVAQMKNTNWWIFHGAKDDVVPPDLSRQMHEALLKVNANVKLTMYPEANHNSWDSAFTEPELLPWLFTQRK